MREVNGIKMYDTKDLSEILDVNQRTIIRLRERGVLSDVQLGRTHYTSDHDLNAFLRGETQRAMRNQPRPQPQPQPAPADEQEQQVGDPDDLFV